MIIQIIAVLYPIVVLTLSIFVLYRLRVGRAKEAGGAGFIYSGLILIFLCSIINLIQMQPGYSTWFLSGVYAFIILGKFIILIIGLILFVIGLVLYFSYWGDRDVEVSSHLEKLKLLDNIQQESRFPYPSPELLDRVLKSMLSGLEEEAGAVFLLNRSERRFILVTAAGLGKEETALLEYYPYGRNLVTQAIEDDSPMISSDFRALGGKAQLAASKFRSILVIPLISGRNKLGAVLFFSQEERHYSREFMVLVLPIAEWLSEKIEVGRLGRDLNKSRQLLETRSQQLSDMTRKLERVIKVDGEIPAASEFAERCLGLAGSDEAWLLGFAGGRLTFYGGTASREDFSDNFRTAVISAITKDKAVILNQEATDESGKTFVARSSLLLPADHHGNALLLRNNSGTISVSKEDFQVLEMIAAVAGLVVGGSAAKMAGSSRSRGLKTISDALQLKLDGAQPETDLKAFMPRLASVLSPGSILLLFRREGGYLKVSYSNVNNASLSTLAVAPGEGSTGKAAALRTENTIFGNQSVADNLLQYGEENRIVLSQLFGERKTPSFQGDYPVIIKNQAGFVISVYGFDENSSENMEQHRLICLLAALISLRLDIAGAGRVALPSESIPASGVLSAEQQNEINNDLLAISGYCQLARQDLNLPGATAGAFDSILETTEKLSRKFKLFVSKAAPITESRQTVDLGEIIEEVIGSNSISGNLHMIDGRPLTISLNLKKLPGLKNDRSSIIRLVRRSLGAFARNVEDDEIVTIGAYSKGECVYIDISKHRENFPPVEPVIGFGSYASANSYRGKLKDSDFLEELHLLSGDFAYDRHSKSPSYFSLRLPLEMTPTPGQKAISAGALTILAIDDQAVILDLLAAMCQSLGYKIFAARNGMEGLKIFETHRPDIVISDLSMPGMSGWDLATKVKALSPETPVIIITGWGITVDSDKMKQAGVDFILHKPFRLEQLSDLISKARFSGIGS